MTDSSRTREPSLLQRMAACRGASAVAIEATIALWSFGDRELLARMGIIDQPSGDFRLTTVGAQTIGAKPAMPDRTREPGPPALDARALEAASDAVARSPIKAIYERADDIARAAVSAYIAALPVEELVERVADVVGPRIDPPPDIPATTGECGPMDYGVGLGKAVEWGQW